MAVGVDMFGAGGEGLGGLFVGNELAMDRDKAEMDMAKSQADMAAMAARTRQQDLSNQYEEAILGDKIAAYKTDAATKKETADLDRFNRQGEQFGRLGQVLRGVPGFRRQEVLRQMAAQGGIAEDNPMLQHMMNADPEALPDMMDAFSKGFYEQGDKARAEKFKRDEMAALERQKAADRAAEKEKDRQLRADIAGQTNALRRDLAAISQSGQDRRASQRAAAKTGADGKPIKMTTDQAIAASIMNNPDMTDVEKLEALQRYQYTKATVGRPGTEEQIMGAPTPEQRVERSLEAGRKKPEASQSAGGKAAPQVGTVVKGYKYKGGDPSKQSSWEKQ